MGIFRTLGRGWVAYQAIGLLLVGVMFIVLAVLSLNNGRQDTAAMLFGLALLSAYISYRIIRALRRSE